ncbi:ABC transporter ATP-binding protein [Natronospora cellulosivora (SeqCode)]
MKKNNNSTSGLLGLVRKKYKELLSRQEIEKIDSEYIIQCENLVKIYKIADLEVFALQGLELNIKKGEMIGIIGSSGSGKSTLMNILGGLDTPTAGKVMVSGWNLNKMSYRDRIYYKRDVVGFIWQNTARNLIPYLNALENVRMPMILKGKGGREWAEELLESVGLGDRMDHLPSELSGGQQQRVAIAVSLANQPDILLADEPTGSLDSSTASEIFDVFTEIVDKYNTTIIVVTHDRSLASAVDRAVEIRDGKISTESIRNKKIKYNAKQIGLNLDENAEERTHDKYVVIDSAGRLQLPEDYMKELGISKKAVLKMEEGRLFIDKPQ